MFKMVRRKIPWILVFEAALALRARWSTLPPDDRDRLTWLARKSKGNPMALTREERRDFRRIAAGSTRSASPATSRRSGAGCAAGAAEPIVRGPPVDAAARAAENRRVRPDDAASFQAPAELYDAHVGRYGPQLAAALIDAAALAPGDRVLDVGCGPGPLTRAVATRVGAENVAAVDPSEPFAAGVPRPRPRAPTCASPGPRSSPFADGAFDAVRLASSS